MAQKIGVIGFLVLTLSVSALAIKGFSEDLPEDSQLALDDVTLPDIGPLPSSVPMPAGNVNYQGKVELGQQLYFDVRLSKNNTISCAFCHNPGTGYADVRQTSIGIDGGLGGRQAPTVMNSAFNPLQFWDGRAGSLEEQAIGPIQNPLEMGETPDGVVKKLKAIKGYRYQFQAVFGTEVSLQGIADAIAAYERTIISTDSPYDRFARGKTSAMNDAQRRGLELFRGKARCILCHNGSNFTDNGFHNTGVPQVGPMTEDLGRYYVTHLDRDKGAFKTPTLRSVALTAPYMHDGAFKTLEEVIAFYNQGGGQNANLSSLIKPLGLSDVDKADLAEFLRALTGVPLPVQIPKLP
ncbi:MAG: Cytochrome c peroxidase [Nitrospirota bacterium]|jgi:cytochrome c peroxidase